MLFFLFVNLQNTHVLILDLLKSSKYFYLFLSSKKTTPYYEQKRYIFRWQQSARNFYCWACAHVCATCIYWWEGVAWQISMTWLKLKVNLNCWERAMFFVVVTFAETYILFLRYKVWYKYFKRVCNIVLDRRSYLSSEWGSSTLSHPAWRYDLI